LGVVIEPGEVHFYKKPQKNYVRLGFGSIPLERIEAGILKLAQAALSLK
jgi:DNA-binding transcriptional MocR family regulator